MSILFKSSNEIKKLQNTLNPAIDADTKQNIIVKDTRVYDKSNTNADLSITFGTVLTVPKLLNSVNITGLGDSAPNNAKNGTVKIFSLSANTLEDTGVTHTAGSSRVDTVMLDNSFLSGFYGAVPATGAPLLGEQYNTWKFGQYMFQAQVPPTSLYFYYQPPSRNRGKAQGYDVFKSRYEQYAGASDTVVEIPSSDVPMDVFCAFLTEEYEDKDVKVVYTRLPYVPNGSGDITRRPNLLGNCILELLTNADYGLGIPTSEIDLTSFLDVGPRIEGEFSLESPIADIIETILSERNYKMYRVNGKYTLSTPGSSTFTLTDDVILGSIEIQYPDSTDAPTKIVADYVSYNSGIRMLEIGDSNLNVMNMSIKSSTNLAGAKSVLEYIYTKLNNTGTYRFTVDKAGFKFSAGDKITLDTSFFTADVNVLEMSLNDDFTVDVIAEGDVDNITAPGVRIPSAPPIIPIIGGNLYRPPEDEEIVPGDIDDPNDPNPIDPIIQPKPIGPGAPEYRTISGMFHPYNHVTGSDNLDWYLGSTNDGLNRDSNFDVNGVQTRGYVRNSDEGFIYKNRFSCVYRRLDLPVPNAVAFVPDIHLTDGEKNANTVGVSQQNVGVAPYKRFIFPGFFQNTFTNNALLQYRTDIYPFDMGIAWSKLVGTGLGVEGGGENLKYVFNLTSDFAAGSSRIDQHTHDSSGNLNQDRNSPINVLTPLMQRSGVYRVHLMALYFTQSIRDLYKVEYIGSTTFYGDGRGVLPAFRPVTEYNYNVFGGGTWPYTYTTPPSRSIS